MVYVYTRPMPGYCHEMVTANKDGSFTIVVNDALDYEQKMAAYEHALSHIRKGHFDYDTQLTADEMEIDAHGKEA